jgi:hypothetical protein
MNRESIALETHPKCYKLVFLVAPNLPALECNNVDQVTWSDTIDHDISGDFLYSEKKIFL